MPVWSTLWAIAALAEQPKAELPQIEPPPVTLQGSWSRAETHRGMVLVSGAEGARLERGARVQVLPGAGEIAHAWLKDSLLVGEADRVWRVWPDRSELLLTLPEEVEVMGIVTDGRRIAVLSWQGIHLGRVGSEKWRHVEGPGHEIDTWVAWFEGSVFHYRVEGGYRCGWDHTVFRIGRSVESSRGGAERYLGMVGHTYWAEADWGDDHGLYAFDRRTGKRRAVKTQPEGDVIGRTRRGLVYLHEGQLSELRGTRVRPLGPAPKDLSSLLRAGRVLSFGAGQNATPMPMR